MAFWLWLALVAPPLIGIGMLAEYCLAAMLHDHHHKKGHR